MKKSNKLVVREVQSNAFVPPLRGRQLEDALVAKRVAEQERQYKEWDAKHEAAKAAAVKSAVGDISTSEWSPSDEQLDLWPHATDPSQLLKVSASLGHLLSQKTVRLISHLKEVNALQIRLKGEDQIRHEVRRELAAAKHQALMAQPGAVEALERIDQLLRNSRSISV